MAHPGSVIKLLPFTFCDCQAVPVVLGTLTGNPSQTTRQSNGQMYYMAYHLAILSLTVSNGLDFITNLMALPYHGMSPVASQLSYRVHCVVFAFKCYHVCVDKLTVIFLMCSGKLDWKSIKQRVVHYWMCNYFSEKNYNTLCFKCYVDMLTVTYLNV